MGNGHEVGVRAAVPGHVLLPVDKEARGRLLLGPEVSLGVVGVLAPSADEAVRGVVARGFEPPAAAVPDNGGCSPRCWRSAAPRGRGPVRGGSGEQWRTPRPRSSAPRPPGGLQAKLLPPGPRRTAPEPEPPRKLRAP